MGCEVVVAGGSTGERLEAERLFRERERVFSRFRSQSELCRINRASGHLIAVSELFAETLAIGLRAAEQTEGLVSPTVGAALEAAGYDRDFNLLEDNPEPAEVTKPCTWPSVRVFGRCVRVPEGVRLDLNGVVKSLAVDDSLDLLSGEGYVSAGGDLAARGELNVALPDGETVLLRRGALATSGTIKRTWTRAGRLQHHLIDPRTGLPSSAPWRQVTACGATCLAADIAAKAGFLLGDSGPEWLNRRGIPARFLTADDEVCVNEAWGRSMGGIASCT
jgi:FAD:protein FMN transferase